MNIQESNPYIISDEFASWVKHGSSFYASLTDVAFELQTRAKIIA